MSKTLQPNHIYWRGGIAYRYLGQCNVIQDDNDVGVLHVAVPLREEDNPVITAALAEDLMLGREVMWKPRKRQRTVTLANQKFTVVSAQAGDVPDPDEPAVAEAITQLAARSRKFTRSGLDRTLRALREHAGNVLQATKALNDEGMDISAYTVSVVLKTARAARV